MGAITFFVGVFLGYVLGGWVPVVGVFAVVVCGGMLLSTKKVLPMLGFFLGTYSLSFLFGGLLGSGISGHAFVWLRQLLS